MTEGAAPSRLTIAWSLDAQAELRAIDRQNALDILRCIDRYLAARNAALQKQQAGCSVFPFKLLRHKPVHNRQS